MDVGTRSNSFIGEIDMTIASWKEEFYPVEAKDCPVEDAIEHSLDKWKGLRRENLEKHGLVQLNSEIGERQGYHTFNVNSISCALCKHHLDVLNSCPECSISKIRRMACDRGKDAPWVKFVVENNPEPMIELLEEALRRQREGYIENPVCSACNGTGGEMLLCEKCGGTGNG